MEGDPSQTAGALAAPSPPVAPVVTLGLPEHGPLLRQDRHVSRPRLPLVFASSFFGGWSLSIFDRGVWDALPVFDSLAMTLGAASLLATIATVAVSTRWTRVFGRRRPRPTLRYVRPGQRVRVRGRVEPGDAPPRVGSHWDGVLALYLGRIGVYAGGPFTRDRALQELRGQSFHVVMDSGERVGVDVEHVRFLSHLASDEGGKFRGHPRWTRIEEEGDHEAIVFVFHEDVLRPGDQVEVVGAVDHVVDPRGDGLGYRGPRLATVLRGSPRRPVLVRRVA